MSAAVQQHVTKDELVPADAASLETILITSELATRPSRVLDPRAENAAYLAIVSQLNETRARVIETLVDAALHLCDAGTSGISMLETQPDGTSLFRWTALAGHLAASVNGTTPRNFSPCGVCLDHMAPVLFSHPERRFTYFRAAGVPFVEGLVLPFSVAGRAVGTLWIVTHDESRRFDREDVRVMTQLAAFAGMAYASVEPRVRQSS